MTTPGRGRGNALAHMLTAALGTGLATFLVLACTGGGGSTATRGDAERSGPVPAPAGTGPPLARSQQGIIAKVEPGVVIINTMLQYDSEAAAGTGVVLNPDGLVLTNNHVIQDSTSISATVPSTRKTYTAHVVGYDKADDIALIQLQRASGLTTVPVGNSSSLQPGQPVVALGNANGASVVIAARGQVTGLGQTITASDDAGSTGTETLHGMIQTNADIVAGDSGGPLSNSGGVIGMDTAGTDPSSPQQPATGFAIPINTALSIARQIAASRSSATVAIGYPGFMGIFIGSGRDSNPQGQARQQQQSGPAQDSPSCATSNAGLSMPSAIAPVSSGVLVEGSICGSPAAQAGMTGGSVITAMDGRAVGSPDDLGRVQARLHPGDTVSVTWVSPAGQRTTSRLRLAAGPPQ
jgi:S1-C subfamily serine protease